MFLSVGVRVGGLKTLAGKATIPIGWWWEQLGTSNASLALSLMTTWFFYLAVSVVEAGTWIVYMYRDKEEKAILEWAVFYFSTIGYWGSIVGYFFPFLFAVI